VVYEAGYLLPVERRVRFSITAPLATVSLRVQGNVPDARVTIDDIPIGASGAQVNQAPMGGRRP